MNSIIGVLLLASTVYAVDDHGRLFSWSSNAEQSRQINHQFYIESNGGNENYNNQYSQNATNGGGDGGGTYTVDELIDSILASNRQGRNLDGFDEVYSDPTVQNALQKGDDSQARNLIKEKLCNLGLMQCEGATGSDIDHKNAFLRPGELIYAQPPSNIPYRGGPPPQFRPPTKTIIYGAPRPMPPGIIKQQSFGPPRKVGYAPGPVYTSSPTFIGSPPSGFGGGPSISGPIYHSKPPGAIIDSPPPYKFDNLNTHGGEHIISNEEFHALGLGGDHGPVKAAINDGITGSGSSNSLNIHHHYHHIDGAGSGQHDSAKAPAVIVNNPIPVPVASAPLPLVTGKFAFCFAFHFSLEQ